MELGIMGNGAFWDYFNNDAGPKLAHRETTFRKIFEYLDTLKGPVTIVETGCCRTAGNWAGDGQSTILFDKYICNRDNESICYTVDINEAAVENCTNLVSSRVHVKLSDSVFFLNELSKAFKAENKLISFAYLDSFDVDWVHWQPSAIHHLKELVALKPIINENTLVVVDDCPFSGNFIVTTDQALQAIGAISVGGKGRLINEYAEAVGAQRLFASYQAGWIGF